MPDNGLDGRLAVLRDELRAAVPVPDVDSVARRHRDRRTRRRTVVGATVAVLAVSVAVPVLRELEPAEPIGTPPPPVAENLPFVNQVRFADEDHGYALRADCEDESTCAPILLAADGPADWKVVGPVPHPEQVPDVGLLDALMVLGPDEVAVDWVPMSGPGSGAATRVYSDDGGRTWSEVAIPLEVTDVEPSIPEGAQLQPGCPRVKSCPTPTLTVVRPGSGESAVLANPPPLRDAVPGAIPTADGYWWAVGQRPGERTMSLAVSADDGRTWNTRATSFPASASGAWWVVSRDGVLYASVRGEAPTGDEGVLAIYRSDDGGRNWQRTWTLADNPEFDGFYGELIAAADGTLIVSAPDEAYVSTDGGRTLVPSEPRAPSPLLWTRLGYLALTDDGYALSTDGLEWRRYEIPLE